MDIFGILGYLLICSFYPPQIQRVWRTKSADDLSIHSLWMLFIGAFLLEISMVVYGGYLIYQLGNGFAMVCAFVLLLQWYHYRQPTAWCYWQERTSDFPREWTCTAQLNQGRANKCPYGTAHDSQDRLYKCTDYRPARRSKSNLDYEEELIP